MSFANDGGQHSSRRGAIHRHGTNGSLLSTHKLLGDPLFLRISAQVMNDVSNSSEQVFDRTILGM